MAGKKKLVFGVSVVAGLVIAAIGLYVGYFAVGKRALPHTQVGSVNVAGMTEQEIAHTLDDTLATKHVVISGNGIEETPARMADLGVSVQTGKLARSVVAQSRSLRALVTAPFTHTRIAVPVSSDPRALMNFTSRLDSALPSATKPVNPTIVSQNGTFIVKPGKNGNGVIPAPLKAAAERVLATQADVRVAPQIGSVEPTITVEALQAKANAANELIAPNVSLRVGSKTVEASANDKAAWVDLSTDHPRVADAKVKEYVNKLSTPLNVDPIVGLRYLNSHGDVTLVKTQARPGVTVTNTDQLVDEICANITAKKATNAAFVTSTAPEQWKEKTIADGAEKLVYPAAAGEKWIDVNLATAQMSAYEGATRVRGPIKVITGIPPKFSTIQGTFQIERKYKTKTMRGTDFDGTQYVDPGVPNAMFFQGGYAIHGAPWWSAHSWATKRYGSHGCVNTPPAEAAWLYGWAPLGTTVVTHR